MSELILSVVANDLNHAIKMMMSFSNAHHKIIIFEYEGVSSHVIPDDTMQAAKNRYYEAKGN